MVTLLLEKTIKQLSKISKTTTKLKRTYAFAVKFC